MTTKEIIGISIFGLLVLMALASAYRNSVRQRKQIASYCFSRGYTLLEFDEPRLAKLTEVISPDQAWTPLKVVLVESHPRLIFLFTANQSSQGRRATSIRTFACLAERAVHRAVRPVVVSPRVPGLGFLVGKQVETGTDEFRKEYRVTSDDTASALATVTPAFERILLDHAATHQWRLDTFVSSNGVMIASTWARRDDDWDYLIALARRLRDVL